ncbi:unnamed protein product [Rotaria socialis]|uniref:Uncharacterized protein n=1 Tax=Rotaria socialis TaxID=392032 RepID=A0A820T815_9BILA|nr:unnamed protein product [Rotaria socialis]
MILMISIESNYDSSKKSLPASLQIRTNKHRCFIFCIGHTSLTCVPGIGKKNKQLLNQSGIHDLTTLYSKYRSIDNIEDFKQWLMYDIGFTSYQANMTTCGISSKLGDFKDTYTGLLPICCSSKERRNEKYSLLLNHGNINKRYRHIQSTNEKINEREIKRLKIEEIKSDKRLINSFHDQIENQKLVNTSIEHEAFISATVNDSITNKGARPSPIDDQLFSSSRDQSSNKYESSDNQISQQTTTDVSIDSQKQKCPSLEQISLSHEFPMDNLSLEIVKFNPATTNLKLNNSTSSQQLHLNSIFNSIEQTLSIKESLNVSSKVDSELTKFKHNRDQEQINEITTEKSSITHKSTLVKVGSNLLTESLIEENSQAERNEELPAMDHNNLTMLCESSSDSEDKLNGISASAQEQLQFTVEVIQDEKDELLSAIEISPNSTFKKNLSRKSILRSTQSNSSSHFDTSVLLASIKQQERTQTKLFSKIKSSIAESTKTIINDKTNLGKTSKSTEVNNKSISAIRRSYALLPVSTPAALPIKPKSMKKIDNKFNNISLISSSNNPSSKKENDLDQDEVLAFSQIMNDTNGCNRKYSLPTAKLISSTVNLSSVMSDNKPQEHRIQNFEEEIEKMISHIMNQALQIAHEARKSSELHRPPFAIQSYNEQVQSTILSPMVKSKSKDSRCLALLEQDSIVRNATSQIRIDQYQNNTTNIKENSSDNSKPKHIQQDYSNILSTVNPMSLSNTGNILNEISSPKINSQSLVTDQKLNNQHQQEHEIDLTTMPTDGFPTTNVSKHNPVIEFDSFSVSNKECSLSKCSIAGTEKLSEPMKISSSPLSSSDSMHSINRINAAIDKIQYHSNLGNCFEKVKTNKNSQNLCFTSSEIFDNTIASSNIIQCSKEFSNAAVIPPCHTSRLPTLQNIKENESMKKNLSEIINRNEKFESKNQISSPVIPSPCISLWENISNEKIQPQNKDYHFTFIDIHQEDQKINSTNHNQNSYSSNALFTFITRQQYLKERQILNEHILYNRRTKPS